VKRRAAGQNADAKDVIPAPSTAKKGEKKTAGKSIRPFPKGEKAAE